MVEHRQIVELLKTAWKHVSPAIAFVTALIKKAHVACQAQTAPRSSSELLRRPADQRAEPTVGSMDQALCEYIGTLALQGHAFARSPRAVIRTHQSKWTSWTFTSQKIRRG